MTVLTYEWLYDVHADLAVEGAWTDSDGVWDEVACCLDLPVLEFRQYGNAESGVNKQGEEAA